MVFLKCYLIEKSFYTEFHFNLPIYKLILYNDNNNTIIINIIHYSNIITSFLKKNKI